MRALLLTAAAVSLYAGFVTYRPTLAPLLGHEEPAGEIVPGPPDAVMARLLGMRAMRAFQELGRSAHTSALDYLAMEAASMPAADQVKLDVWLAGEQVITMRFKVAAAGPDHTRVAVEASLVPSRLTMSPHLLDGDRAHLETFATVIARAYIVRSFDAGITERELKQRFEGAMGLSRHDRDQLAERLEKALLASYPDQILAADDRADLDRERVNALRQAAYERSRGLAPRSAPAWEAEMAAANAEAAAR